MYGFVNYALELLVIKTFGEETWERIKKEADVTIEGQFLVRQIYDDDVTYNIVGAAVKLLQIPADTILELFGKMFFEFCQDAGYDKILQVLGATPRDFLQNLDALHDHLGTLYPGMRAPSFRCTERPEDGALVLHYYSDRPGLEHIVIGIVKEVAKQLHDTEVEVSILQAREEGGDHVQFLIAERAAGPGRQTRPQLEELQHTLLSQDKQPIKITLKVRPHLELNFENILSHINTVYVLKTKPGAYHRGPRAAAAEPEFNSLRLKGQMLYIAESELVVFLCYPSVMNLDDLTKRGLYISDIPLHDATRDLVLLSEQFEAEYKLTRNLEILTDKLQSTYRELDSEKQKTDRLLYSVLPISVATELRHNRPVPARRYDCVTLLFSGIMGFGAYCAAHSDARGAMQIVRMLNRIYTLFDVLTDPGTNPNIYKIVRMLNRIYTLFDVLTDPGTNPNIYKVWTVLRKKKYL
ncbi:hypothetical protein B566_EDAN000814 [Ephemera danica]|nr:hypothetical protein B566_EDAN000814 [Ephemera danica]